MSLIFRIGKWFLLTKCVLYNQKHLPFTKKISKIVKNLINLAKSHTSRCEIQSVMDEQEHWEDNYTLNTPH